MSDQCRLVQSVAPIHIWRRDYHDLMREVDATHAPRFCALERCREKL